MGKRRKAVRSAASIQIPHSVPINSKVSINSWEDVADSEDEFLMQREKVMLDEGRKGRARNRMREEEKLLELSDEEVLAYPESRDNGHFEEEEELEEEYEEEEDTDGSADGDDVHTTQNRAESSASSHSEEEEGLSAWGPSVKNYYGADVIHTEEALKAEAEEARRIQLRQLSALTEADFGLEDDIFAVAESAKPRGDEEDDVASMQGVVTEVLPEPQLPRNTTDEERLEMLRSRYPEFLPLANEFVQLQPSRAQLSTTAQKCNNAFPDLNSGPVTAQLIIAKHRALSAYLGALAMYFAILTSTATENGNSFAKAPYELRDHPIMDVLLHTRKTWNLVKELDTEGVEEDLELLAKMEKSKLNDSDVIDQKVEANGKFIEPKPKIKQTQPELTKAEAAAENALAQAAARRAKRMQAVEEDLASLDTLVKKLPKAVLRSRRAETSQRGNEAHSDSDFGDEPELTAHEAAEKAQRKKSLRFYTSRMAQKSHKRGAAGRDAGGDADIPYRERLRDRQARLQEAKEARRARRGDDAGAGENLGAGGGAASRPARGHGASDADLEYYDMVVAKEKQKKAERKRKATEAFETAGRDVGARYAREEVGPDGKRRITFEIEKNKGLTPFRKKEVRNPRVKKRMKFEQQKKKLSSIRPVYKGGEGPGGYHGELSGIKTGVVKSIKL